MPLKQSITAEQAIADKTQLNEYQVDNKKQITATVDVKELHPGHRMFEWNVSEGVIKPAEILDKTVLIGRKKSFKEYIEYLIRPGCFYQPALNAQNAEKKFKKKVIMKGGKTISQMEKA